MNKKGFTLIELLAVIAILAIIMLIATPMVLGTIADAKKSAAKSSAQMIWKSTETYIATQVAKGEAVAAAPTLANIGVPAGDITLNTLTVASNAVSEISITQNGYTCTSTTTMEDVTCS